MIASILLIFIMYVSSKAICHQGNNFLQNKCIGLLASSNICTDKNLESLLCCCLFSITNFHHLKFHIDSFISVKWCFYIPPGSISFRRQITKFSHENYKRWRLSRQTKDNTAETIQYTGEPKIHIVSIYIRNNLILAKGEQTPYLAHKWSGHN